MSLHKVGCFIALYAASVVPAHAGVMVDDLTRCVLTKATDADRNAFMAWMFSAISASPQLSKLTTLDRAKRDELSTVAGATMQRLLITDCHDQAVAAIKSEGPEAFKQPFGELGRQATEQMFRSTESQVELEALGKGFDDEKFKDLAREAGIPEDQLKKAEK